jgi:hypothetical protein
VISQSGLSSVRPCITINPDCQVKNCYDTDLSGSHSRFLDDIVATHRERDENSEIEVTPEMVEAALPLPFSFEPGKGFAAEVAEEIYRAMKKAKLHGTLPGHDG